MNVVLTLVSISALALCLLIWLLSRLGDRKGTGAEAKPQAEQSAEPARVGQQELSNQELPAQEQQAPEAKKDVNFRIQGERGMGGPVYGDVMCADGVYLPHVWESDIHTSFDGRWLRTGFYDSETAHLVDRKTRRSWVIQAGEAEALDAVHWRMPRWSGETINESGIADDAHVIFSDASFEAWLTEHVGAQAEPLLQLRDIWLPKEYLPAHAGEQAPELVAAPVLKAEPGKLAIPAPELALERHWPPSLRHLHSPLAPLQQPNWRLLMAGKPTPWMIDDDHAMVWRDDAQALALYAYPADDAQEYLQRRLVVWTAEQGWQQWAGYQPHDRKSWSVNAYWPEPEESSPLPPLSWDETLLLQRVQVDTPETERLHDGTSISCVASSIEGCAEHERDGQVKLKPIPVVSFCWLRDPARPEVWRAQSESVQGKPLIWTLSKEARDEQGETSAWNLQWGDKHFSGSWALEHVIVRGRWAVLMPFGRAPIRGGAGQLQVWDGERLQTVDLPWPVERIRPVPGKNNGPSLRVRLIALVASLDDKDWDPSLGSWRWPVHSVSSSHLARPDWRPVYMHREIAPDAQGRWRLLPRWREVNQIQHPCADGDYVWRDAARGDALWWWGGQNQRVNSYWSEDEYRIEGVTMTRSGLALCGTGPCACPHPAGEGWAVLEFVDHHYARANEWKLHWLNPVEKELRTLVLAGNMPLLTAWDTQGLHWVDTQPDEEDATASDGSGAAQLITLSMWDKAEVEPLRQGQNGLWLRKQDLRYAQTLQAQDDCPWRS